MPPQSLVDLIGDLDFANLRIRRPTKFIFFCGGAMGEPPDGTKSLRSYLLVKRSLGDRLSGDVILAERATQLYRDTAYSDLITFEEDIARIAAAVMLIAESPGSFAELGAFATNDTIRRGLLVLGQTLHSDDNSFVRYGPMERVRKADERRLAFYPWRTRSDGTIVKRSISGHFSRIKALINDHLSRIPLEQLYEGNADLAKFAHLLWILHICTAMTADDLHSYLESCFGSSDDIAAVRNKLYCMKLAGWVSSYNYENRVYWYSLSGDDPFRYRFLPTASSNDSVRRKAEVMSAARQSLKIPRHVLEVASKAKVVAGT